MFYVKMLVMCQVARACKTAQFINEGLPHHSKYNTNSQTQLCGRIINFIVPVAAQFFFLLNFMRKIYNLPGRIYLLM